MIAFLLDLTLRSTAIFCLTLGVTLLMGRRSAAERHLVLLAGVLVALLLPLGLALSPKITFPLTRPENPSRIEAAVFTTLVTARTPDSQPAPETAEKAPVRLPTLPDILIALAAGGMLLQLVRQAACFWSLKKIRRKAIRFRISAAAMETAQRTTKLLPSAWLSPDAHTPFLSGWLRPRLIFPADAASWPDTKLSMVLIHESAHLRRGDHLLQALLNLTCILYWWHPLAAVVLARLRREREQACDDLVLQSGVRPSDYAQVLIEVAQPARFSPASIAMASSGRIEHRIKNILDPALRRNQTGLRWLYGIMIACAGCWLLLSSIELRAEQKPTDVSDTKFGTASLASAPFIEIEPKYIQFSSEAYREYKDKIEALIREPESLSVFLKELNQVKGVDLVSSPRVTTRSGQKAIISIVREFAFPSAFENFKGRSIPAAFETRNLGIEFEVTAEPRKDRILVAGLLRYTEFLGMTGSKAPGLPRPNFQTREGYVLQDLPNGVFTVIPLPWERPEYSLLEGISPEKIKKQETETQDTPFLLFLKVTSVEPPGPRHKAEKISLEVRSTSATSAQIKAAGFEAFLSPESAAPEGALQGILQPEQKEVVLRSMRLNFGADSVCLQKTSKIPLTVTGAEKLPFSIRANAAPDNNTLDVDIETQSIQHGKTSLAIWSGQTIIMAYPGETPDTAMFYLVTLTAL